MDATVRVYRERFLLNVQRMFFELILVLDPSQLFEESLFIVLEVVEARINFLVVPWQMCSFSHVGGQVQ